MGTANSSIPVVGNFDPNGPSEVGVFTLNGQGQGVWSIASSLSGTRTFVFGQAGDIPVVGDFDAIGYDEPAVYRPSTGQFLVPNPVYQHHRDLSIPGVGSARRTSAASSRSRGSTITWPTTGIQRRPSPATPRRPSTTPRRASSPSSGLTASTPSPGSSPATSPPRPTTSAQGLDQVVVYRPSTGQFIEGSTTVG